MSETNKQNPRKKLVAGNWKMNGSFDSNEALILGFLPEVDDQVDVSVFCPFPYLSQVGKLLEDQNVAFGSQDVSAKPSGAYT
ncbi:triose-phosphate isomerase, partial [Vibrio vulnificus]|uniref:triose-phosphate isomerase n=2 Tax=Pseudomonadota TaxID=1224 RepID=UPI0039B44C5B